MLKKVFLALCLASSFKKKLNKIAKATKAKTILIMSIAIATRFELTEPEIDAKIVVITVPIVAPKTKYNPLEIEIAPLPTIIMTMPLVAELD